MKEKWDFPVISSLREKVRARTPGVIPALREEHPVAGLLHDVQRLKRRKAAERRRKIFGGPTPFK